MHSYDASARMCRVEIPGLTDGGDVLPLAEIEYSIGDKSRIGTNATEIEITPGDTIWVAFIGGDARYPVITGYRNPQTGNSTGWRRWHHANIELLANAVINLIAQGDVLIKSGSHVTVQAPSVTVQANNTHVRGNLTVDGAVVAKSGLSVSGGAGVSVQGNINASGAIMDGGGNSNHHSH